MSKVARDLSLLCLKSMNWIFECYSKLVFIPGKVYNAIKTLFIKEQEKLQAPNMLV